MNAWVSWLFITGVIVTVLFAFNYQGGKDTIPLSEIFPDEESGPVDIEYIFTDKEVKQQKVISGNPLPIPVVKGKRKSVNVRKKIIVKEEKSNTVFADKNILKNIYTIQVASYREKTLAENGVSTLKLKGFEGFFIKKDLGDKGTWYRVNSGRYSNMDQAKRALAEIKDLYKGSFIINIKK